MENKHNRKNKKIKNIKYICLLLAIISSSIVWKNSDMYSKAKTQITRITQPPFKEDNIVNNEYFEINSMGKNARETTKGINEAIEYAAKNGIEFIKLEKGIYLIDGKEKNNNINESNSKKGIILQSNITLDLNGSKIIQEKNGAKCYANISITEVENVKIINGILIGDKSEHDYTTINSSHEWGFGVDIRSSKNVELNNIEICDMTGDGVMLNSYYNTDNVTKNITIKNCCIHDCRRQGISLIYAQDIDILENEIYSIGGTVPELAIDIEPEASSQFVYDVRIKNNKLYNGICMQRNTKNIQIAENYIYNGKIKSYQILDDIKIKENYLINSNIDMRLNTRNGEKVEISGNYLDNTKAYFVNISNLKFSDNKIKNEQVVIVSSNGAVYNNILETDEEKEYRFLLYDIKW